MCANFIAEMIKNNEDIYHQVIIKREKMRDI